MFTKDAQNLLALRPENQHLILFNMAKSGVATTDRATALAELEKRLLCLDSTWQAFNGGIRETITSGGISTIVAGDGSTKHPAGTGYTELVTDIILSIAAAWETSASVRRLMPVVEYDGVPIPWIKYTHLGDGYTADDRVICIDNTDGAYATTASRWRVSFVDTVIGLKETSLGGKSLSQTEETENVHGVSTPVITRTKNDGSRTTGSFAVLAGGAPIYIVNGATGAADEILNNPGEDIQERIYADAWTPGSANEKTYLATDRTLCLALVSFNPGFPAFVGAAADRNQIFASINIHYDVQITNFDALQNATADATQVIRIPLQVSWDEQWDWVIRTTV